MLFILMWDHPFMNRNLMIMAAGMSSRMKRSAETDGVSIISKEALTKPKMMLIKKNRGVAVYDADDGLGHVAALKASAIVSSMAKKNGIASIGIINSYYFF